MQSGSCSLLFLCLDKSVPLSDYWLDIFTKTLFVLTELQQKNMLHRDLSMDTVCFDPATREVKLIDRGHLRHANADGKFYTDEMVNTHSSSAPEIKYTKPYAYSEKTEIYSVGVVFQLVVELSARVRGEPLIADVSEAQQVFEFTQRMMRRFPEDRPSLKEAREFFTALAARHHPAGLSPVSTLGLFKHKVAQAESHVAEQNMVSDPLETRRALAG